MIIARFNPGATTRILFLAHWDTRPRADAAGSRDSTLPVPGANDGASGVAVLLAMADALDKTPPGVGVDLLFVDGEDYGSFDYGRDQDVLLGSRHYAAHLPPGAKGHVVNIVDQRVLRPAANFFSYSASKAGLWWVTQTMAQALAPAIRVNRRREMSIRFMCRPSSFSKQYINLCRRSRLPIPHRSG